MTQASMNAFNHPFWRFSLAVYEEPRVQELCLALQDDWGLDVNLLLFACWLGGQSQRLSVKGAELERIRHWHNDIVRPLRALRRAQSKQTEAGRRLRRMLQETELKAEQCEQWLLFQAASSVSSPGEESPLQQTMRNLLDVAAFADQPDKTLFQQLRELALLSHPETTGEELYPPSPEDNR